MDIYKNRILSLKNTLAAPFNYRARLGKLPTRKLEFDTFLTRNPSTFATFCMCTALTSHFFAGGICYLIFISLFALNFAPNTKLARTDLALLTLLPLLFAIKLWEGNGTLLIIQGFRYYFGFIFYYFIFKYLKDHRIDFQTVVILASLIIFFETFLLNTSEAAKYIKPYMGQYNYTFFGSYERPLGFGVNASVTGALFAVLLAINHITQTKFNPFTEVVGIIGSLLVISGVSYLCLFVYLLRRWIILTPLFIVGALLLIETPVAKQISWKVGPENIVAMYSLKESTIKREWKDLTNIGYGSIIVGKKILGSKDGAGNGGDIDLWTFFTKYGLIGILILVTAITKIRSFEYLFPIALLLVSSLHYGVFSSNIGQILFGYCIYHGSTQSSLKDS
jgi:hypothetical protein